MNIQDIAQYKIEREGEKDGEMCMYIIFFRWHNLTLLRDMVELDVSPSLSLFLQKLQHTLHKIRTSINAHLLDHIFDKICSCIDDIFMEQVMS